MEDFTSFIMSLDTNQAIPIGLASLLGVGLITYFLLKPKNKNKVLSSEDGEIKIISNDLTDVPTESIEPISRQEPSDDNSIFKSILEDSKISRLDESTIDKFDVHFNHEQKEPITTNKLSESEQLLHSLASDSEKIDQQRKEQEKIDTESFEQAFGGLNLNKSSQIQNQSVKNDLLNDGLAEQFGSIAKTIEEEKRQPESNNKDCFDIWVNYMGVKQGKMLLMNTFVSLSSPWGSISAINELSTHIEKEVEADPFGGKKSWAIISVTEINR